MGIMQRADRHQVVAGEYRRGFLISLQKISSSCVAALELEIPFEDKFWMGMDELVENLDGTIADEVDDA